VLACSLCLHSKAPNKGTFLVAVRHSFSLWAPDTTDPKDSINQRDIYCSGQEVKQSASAGDHRASDSVHRETAHSLQHRTSVGLCAVI